VAVKPVTVPYPVASASTGSDDGTGRPIVDPNATRAPTPIAPTATTTATTRHSANAMLATGSSWLAIRG
jgi:hypothetical protein